METLPAASATSVVGTFNVPVPDGFVHLSLAERGLLVMMIRVLLHIRPPRAQSFRAAALALIPRLDPTARQLADSLAEYRRRRAERQTRKEPT